MKEVMPFLEALADERNLTTMGALADYTEENNHPLAPLYRSMYNNPENTKEHPRGSAWGLPTIRHSPGVYTNHHNSRDALVQHLFFPLEDGTVETVLSSASKPFQPSKNYIGNVSIEEALKAINYLKNEEEVRSLDEGDPYGRIIPNEQAVEELQRHHQYVTRHNYARTVSRITSGKYVLEMDFIPPPTV